MGELLTLLTAVLWAGSGLVWSEGGRQGTRVLPLFAVIVTVTASLSFVAWGATGAQVPDIWSLGAGLVVAGGLICAVGSVTNAQTMKSHPEHTSAIWTVYQLCMVIPFLWSTLGWRERPLVHQWVGFAGVIVALILLAPRGSAESRAANGRGWLAPTLFAFLVNGLSQALIQESSHIGWQGAAFAKAVAVSCPVAVSLWVACLVVRAMPNLREWRFGLIGGLIGVVASGSLFGALDALRATGREYVVFPTAVGGCIVVLAAFQFATGRETVGFRKVAGVLVGCAGVAMLALKL